MSDNTSATLSLGQLSPDGYFRWDGVRWIYATSAPSTGGSPAMVVSPKSAGLAVIASFLLPGLGSMINGEGGKGAAMLVGFLVLQLLFWMTIWFLVGLIFLPFILGLWVWGMYDGYEGARRWNASHGIVS